MQSLFLQTSLILFVISMLSKGISRPGESPAAGCFWPQSRMLDTPDWDIWLVKIDNPYNDYAHCWKQIFSPSMYRFQHLSGGLHPGTFRKWSSAYFGKKPFSCPAIDCLKRETASSPTGNRVALLRSESPNGMCAKLRTVAASNNRVHPTRSL